LTRLSDIEPVISSLSAASQEDPDLAIEASRALSRPAVLTLLEPHHIPYLKELPNVLQTIVSSDALDHDVVEAARADLEEA
jgi:hypothetical protein